MRDPLIGQALDRYQIISLLGQGGMGAVYKGHDPNLLRDVAIKIMHARFARQPDFQARFLQEARTAARLDHPSIVQVHDFGQARSLLYIVMEFIPGDNLSQLLKSLQAAGKWIELSEAIPLVRHVCLTIDYVHRQGVLHRDLKPDNIMLKSEPSDQPPYRPVLTDLGLAKLAEGDQMTRGGMILGTLAYMSPEQAQGEPTDARSDVYSLGILLYELAVGRLPFPINTASEAIRYHTQETPPAPRSIRPDLPESVERVILKALEKSPANRFPSAKAMAEALVDVSPGATALSPPAAVREETAGLMTEYQASLVTPRGSSVLADFPQTFDEPGPDHLTIKEPNRAPRSVPIQAQELTIGRDADNEVVLVSSQVSRHHARVEFDGTNYRIVDLGSRNGTYLANAKLLTGVPEVWMPDRHLRMGDVWLRLDRNQRPGQQSFLPTGGTVVDGRRTSSSLAGRVGVFIETDQLKVAPGSIVTIPLVVLNQSEVVDTFNLSVSGVPAGWLPVPPPPIQLLPGGQQEVALSIQPARSSQSLAGRYPLTIRATSQDAPDQKAEVKTTLTVTAYSQFSSELRPQTIRAGRPAQVTIQNRGNAPETFQLTWQDPAEELAFRPARTEVVAPPGQTTPVGFRATPRQRRWIGREKIHAFSVQVSSADGQPQIHAGEIVSRGLIPIWILPLILLLCVACTAAAAIAIPRLSLTPTPTATLQPNLLTTNPITPALSPTPELPMSMPTPAPQPPMPIPTPIPQPPTPTPQPPTSTPTSTSTSTPDATATAQAVAAAQTATAFSTVFPGSDPPIPADGGPIPYIHLGYVEHDRIVDGATIRNCQNQPMEWPNVNGQPVIVRYYDIEVAATSDFAAPIVTATVAATSEAYQQYDIEQYRKRYTYGALYYYRLRARNSTNPTDWSPPGSFRWPQPPVVAPEPLTPLDGATVDANPPLEWGYSGPIGDPFEGDCFRLQITDDSTFNSGIQASPLLSATLSYSFPTLVPGQYFWRITACNNAGPDPENCGPFSPSRTFDFGTPTPTPTPP